MKRLLKIGKLTVLLVLAATASARASVILDVSSALTAGDATQSGRLSRNAVAQTWDGDEPFPGVINVGTNYAYRTYVLNTGLTPFIQVNFDSLSANTFVSAYSGSYNPASLATNWLGDAGSSGNSFVSPGNPLGDPTYFQVVAPLGGNIVLVINQTLAGTPGLGDPFRLLVEGFTDTEFGEPPSLDPVDPGTPVPEPATLILGGSGMALMALKRRFQRAA
jgi:hypothetical protein